MQRIGHKRQYSDQKHRISAVSLCLVCSWLFAAVFGAEAKIDDENDVVRVVWEERLFLSDNVKPENGQVIVGGGWVDMPKVLSRIEDSLVFWGREITPGKTSGLARILSRVGIFQGTGKVHKPASSPNVRYFILDDLAAAPPDSDKDVLLKESFKRNSGWSIQGLGERFGLLQILQTNHTETLRVLAIFGGQVQTISSVVHNNDFLKRIRRLRVKSLWPPGTSIEGLKFTLQNSEAQLDKLSESTLQVHAQQAIRSILDKSRSTTAKNRYDLDGIKISTKQKSDLVCDTYYASISNFKKFYSLTQVSTVIVVSLTTKTEVRAWGTASRHQNPSNLSSLVEIGVSREPRKVFVHFEGKQVVGLGISRPTSWLKFKVRSCYAGAGKTDWVWEIKSSNNKWVRKTEYQTYRTSDLVYRNPSQDASRGQSAQAAAPYFVYTGWEWLSLPSLAVETFFKIKQWLTWSYQISQPVYTIPDVQEAASWISSFLRLIARLGHLHFMMALGAIAFFEYIPWMLARNHTWRNATVAAFAVADAFGWEPQSVPAELKSYFLRWGFGLVWFKMLTRLHKYALKDWWPSKVTKNSTCPKEDILYTFLSYEFVDVVHFTTILLEFRDVNVSVGILGIVIRGDSSANQDAWCKSMLVGVILKLVLAVLEFVWRRMYPDLSKGSIGIKDQNLPITFDLGHMELRATWFERYFTIFLALKDIFLIFCILSETPITQLLGIISTLYWAFKSFEFLPAGHWSQANSGVAVSQLILLGLFSSSLNCSQTVGLGESDLLMISIAVIYLLMLEIASRVTLSDTNGRPHKKHPGEQVLLPYLDADCANEMGMILKRFLLGWESSSIFTKRLLMGRKLKYYEGHVKTGGLVGPGRYLTYDPDTSEWKTEFFSANYTFSKQTGKEYHVYRHPATKGDIRAKEWGEIKNERGEVTKSLLSNNTFNQLKIYRQGREVTFLEGGSSAGLNLGMKMYFSGANNAQRTCRFTRGNTNGYMRTRAEAEYCET